MEQNLTKNNANCQIRVSESIAQILKGALPIERLRDTELVKLCVIVFLASQESKPFVRNVVRDAAKYR